MVAGSKDSKAGASKADAEDEIPGGDIPVWGAYLRALQKAPVRTKLITSVVMMSTSQLTGQLLQKGRMTDPKGVRIWGLWGLALATFHTWYQPMLAKHGPKNTALKIMLDHLIHKVPFLYIFAAYDKVMRGEALASAVRYSLDINPGLQRAAVKVWPLIQMVNFTLIPLPLRVLYQNAALFAWVVFLSIKMRVTS
mmetsp:Transcript_32461/g.76263  ORF Transcript_32461/g.76263 Transcript_32461/m.76263 type:complete len:195 (-) Transcript_32461:56-640(-)